MKTKKIFKIIIISIIILIILVLASIFLYVGMTIDSIKDIDLSLTNDVEKVSLVYDNEDNIIENNSVIKYVGIDEINENTKNAFISIEDKNFYEHSGINFKRILKAFYNNIKTKSFKEGASTITQQLVKNRFLSNEKTISRKIKEAYLSLKLEKKESKEKILETYLNSIYYGNGAYGIAEASKMFFNKDVKNLSLSESCILAGTIKSPAKYSIINNYENSIKRRNLVLSEMLEDGYISQGEHDEAINELPTINNNIKSYQEDLYYNYVLDEASEILGKNINAVKYGGYKIYTYQDKSIQNILDSKIANDKYYEKNDYGNTADSLSIIIDNISHGVSAISGRSKYDLVNFKRQPGSLIKPVFVYAPAIEEGVIYPCSKILDEKINYNGYSPNNVGNKFYGQVSVRDSVAKSLNVPTVKLCKEMGLDKCKNYARKCGIEFDYNDNGYAVALGGLTNGVTIKSITDSYSPLINDGNYVNSKFIKEIKNDKNITLYSRYVSETNVYNTSTSYMMTDILDYSVKNGTSKKLNILPYSVAGKTGTVSVKDSNYNTDALSLAYTTEHVMTVWLGNYSMDNKYNLLSSNNGGTYATEIIKDTFGEMYSSKYPSDFVKPNTVVERYIDLKSLEEDNIVVLGDNVPDRFKTLEIFSVDHVPSISSNKFTNIDEFDISLYNDKNSIKVSFDTKDYIVYELHRIIENKDEIINVIKNKNNLYTYIDTDIDYNKKYSYYVVAKSMYSNNSYKTNKVESILTKNYSTLINEIDNNIAWLFS